jgi:hypothetical protein
MTPSPVFSKGLCYCFGYRRWTQRWGALLNEHLCKESGGVEGCDSTSPLAGISSTGFRHGFKPDGSAKVGNVRGVEVGQGSLAWWGGRR